MWEVLQGISWVTVPAGLGGSATPNRLCRMPVPSGRGKKMEPYRGTEQDLAAEEHTAHTHEL